MRFQVIGFWGGYPGRGGATSGYLLQQDRYRLLIDCGSGLLSRLSYFTQPEALQAILLSHFHYDHIADIGVMQYALLVAQQLGRHQGVLPIYAPPHDELNFKRLHKEGVTVAQPLQPGKQLELGPFQVKVMPTRHPTYCLAMRFTSPAGSIVYTADTAYGPELVQFAQAADLLVAEASFYAGMDGQAYGHMNSHDAARLAQEAKVGALLLTHLPHFGQQAQLAEEAATIYLGPIALAHEGWSWNSEEDR